MELLSNEIISNTIEELIKERENGNLRDFVDGPTCCDIYSWVREVERETDFEVAEGETKMVFMSSDLLDWVIKVPRYNEKGIDYCEIEAENYEKACDVHLEKFFAPTYAMGYFFGVPVYIQKKVFCFDEEVESTFGDYMAQDMEDEREEYATDDDFYDAVYDAVNYMGTEDRIWAVFNDGNEPSIVHALCAFCLKEYINDLHSGNFGYDNGSPVIVDFSGYQF